MLQSLTTYAHPIVQASVNSNPLRLLISSPPSFLWSGLIFHSKLQHNLQCVMAVLREKIIQPANSEGIAYQLKFYVHFIHIYIEDIVEESFKGLNGKGEREKACRTERFVYEFFSALSYCLSTSERIFALFRTMKPLNLTFRNKNRFLCSRHRQWDSWVLWWADLGNWWF